MRIIPLIFCCIIIILLITTMGCAGVKPMGTVNFPDCQVKYISATSGSPFSNRLRVIDRYQVKNNETKLIQSDSISTNGIIPLDKLKNLVIVP